MRIKSLPENYTGILAPVIYEIDQAEPSQIVTVGIFAGTDGQAAGEKRLFGESAYTVNAANYVGGRIKVEPVAGNGGAAGTWIAKAEQRCGIVKISAGAIVSAATCVTGGRNVCREKAALSDAPAKRNIAVGENDEIAFIAPGLNVSAKAILSGGEGNAVVDLGSCVCDGGIYVAVIDTGYILGQSAEIHRQMAVEISADGNVLAAREYSIIPASADAVRLCWQNPYGQIDYHTFRIAEENLTLDKSRAYLAEGYATVGLTEEVIIKAVSKLEPRKTLKWLAGILSSPQVWMVEGDGFVKVDVITDKASVKAENPGNISVSFRKAKKLTLKQA